MSTLTERLRNSVHLDTVLDEIVNEITAAEAEHGSQWDLPLGMGSASQRMQSVMSRNDCQQAFRGNRGTWRHIVTEEHDEMLAESDLPRIRAEAIQLAAMAAKIVMVCDRRLDNNDPAAA